MKLLFPVAFILLMAGCSASKDSDEASSSDLIAEEIVLKSIEKHGGKSDWENLKSISYNKVTILFDSSGAQESSIIQRHLYNLKPELDATIRWIENGDSIKIVYKHNEANQYVNGTLDSSAAEAAKATVDAALYVLFQPFKLMDDNVILKYMGIDSLDGRPVHMVKPVYSGQQPGDDEWIFYFDASTDELMANLVNHNGRRSFIKNLAFDPTISLYLHQHRKSYFVDSALNIQYLRAEYFYTNYELTY